MEGKSSQIKLLMAYTIYMIPIADTLLAKSHYCLPNSYLYPDAIGLRVYPKNGR
jgi:hypothetical protein